MTPKRPDVVVGGDNADRTMWRRGHIRGFNPILESGVVMGAHVIWVFGFLPNSPRSKAWGGISITRPELGWLWVMAKQDGEVIMKHRGWLANMPPIMKQVLR